MTEECEPVVTPPRAGAENSPPAAASQTVTVKASPTPITGEGGGRLSPKRLNRVGTGVCSSTETLCSFKSVIRKRGATSGSTGVPWATTSKAEGPWEGSDEQPAVAAARPNTAARENQNLNLHPWPGFSARPHARQAGQASR
jgi:hypothetical protein